MNLLVERIADNGDSTLGVLYEKVYIHKGYHKELLSFTIEDEARTIKVYGETRIPEGTYTIRLRNEGGFHQKYSAKYSSMHKGMLWLQDVPGFEYVLIHTGNDDEDTAGCLLVGDKLVQNVTTAGFVQDSVKAYKRIYPRIAQAIMDGNKVTIEYIDITKKHF
jgi:hypothetical protein